MRYCWYGYKYKSINQSILQIKLQIKDSFDLYIKIISIRYVQSQWNEISKGCQTCTKNIDKDSKLSILS